MATTSNPVFARADFRPASAAGAGTMTLGGTISKTLTGHTATQSALPSQRAGSTIGRKVPGCCRQISPPSILPLDDAVGSVLRKFGTVCLRQVDVTCRHVFREVRQ